MRRCPRPDEQLKNAAIFLCLAGQMSGRGGIIGDRLKVQKCTFLVAIDHFQRRLKGFNLTFYRYDYGPFSKQLWDVKDLLEDAGLLVERKQSSKEVGELVLTQAGQSISEELCRDLWSDVRNQPFAQGIEDAAKRCAGKPTADIMEQVYDLVVAPVGGQEQSIRSMPKNVDIIRVLEPEEADAEIEIPDSWLETLAIMLSKQSQQGLKSAEDDMARGRVHSHAEVWA